MNSFLLLATRARLVAKAIRFYLAVCLLSLIGFVPVANAQIVLDFSDDIANQNFFTNNPLAKAALEAAVSDINTAVSFNLGAVTDVTTGVSGNATVRFDFEYFYTNPATGAAETIDNTAQPANVYRIFVGARTLAGNTLGQGGPGGSGFGASISGSTSQYAGAIANAEANETHRRGGGPVISTFNGNFGGASFSFETGLGVGNLWFDDDTNWHFDHTVPVAAGTSDFYSVALHEILHSLGVGASETWDSQVSGTNWLGAETIASNGTGAGIVDPDGGHFAQNIMSPRISNGVLQEVVIDPSLTQGTRKSLTQLDLAVLRDLGFQTNDFVVVVVLGDVNLDDSVSFLDISPFISVLSTGEFQVEADVNQDGTVSFLDISPVIGLLSGQ